MKEINFNIPTIEAIQGILQPILIELNSIKEKFQNPKLEIKYYRNKDLKEIFGLSDKTIQTYREKNIIPYTRVGEIFYYPVQEFEKEMLKNSNYQIYNKKVN